MSESMLKKIYALSDDQRCELYQNAIRKGVLAAELPIVRQDSHKAAYTVLPYQHRMWLMDSLSDNKPFHNIPIGLRITGPLDAGRLFNAMQAVCDRHAALRIYFRFEDGALTQEVAPRVGVPPNLIDLSAEGLLERNRALAELSRVDAETPFDVYTGPLWRMSLVKLALDCHVLLFTVHHLVCDGPSIALLFDSLWVSYAATNLPGAFADFPDYVEWYMDTRSVAAKDAALAYWRGKFSDKALPVLSWNSAGLQTGPEITEAAAVLNFEIPADVRKNLESFSKRSGVSSYMTALAAHFMTLSKITGDTSIVIGSPVSRREHPDAESMVGLFVDTAPLLFSYEEDDTYLSLLGKVRSTVLEALSHGDASFLDISHAITASRVKGRAPVFQNIFTFGGAINTSSMPPGLSTQPMFRHHGAATLDIAVTMVESGAAGGWLGWISYNAAYCTAAHAAEYAVVFQNLLTAIAAAPDKRITELLDGAAKAKEDSLATMVTLSAATYPRNEALRDSSHGLTYWDMDTLANRMARVLQKNYPSASIVAVNQRRGINYAVAILAVLKAGRTYLPLDMKHPDSVRREAIVDSGAQLVIHDGQAGLAIDADSLEFDEWLRKAEHESDWSLARENADVAPAYILYTSGSMGQRRGVVMGNNAARHYTKAIAGRLGIVSSDRYLHTASFGFSSSIRQMFAPLSQGAVVIIAPEEALGNPQSILDIILRHNVSVIDTVPSFYKSIIVHANGNTLSGDIKIAVSSGEILTAGVLSDLQEILPPSAKVFNVYGQTETLGVSALYIEKGTPLDGEIINTGFLLDGVRVDFAADNRDGAREIIVSGPILMDGYLNDLKKHAPKVASHATGDLGILNAEGQLEIVGRNDLQIKVAGQRVNLVETENAICRLLGCSQAIAIASDENGTQLIAFVQGVEAGAIATALERLKSGIASYLCPSRLYGLDAIPKTHSGKTDFAALRKIDRDALSAGRQSSRDTTTFAALTPVQAWAIEKISGVLGRDVLPEDNILRLGADSLMAGRIVAALRTGPHFLSIADIMKAMDSGAIARQFEDLERMNVSAWTEIIQGDSSGLFWIQMSPHGFWTYRDEKAMAAAAVSACRVNMEQGLERTVFVIATAPSAKDVIIFAVGNKDISCADEPAVLLKDMAASYSFRNVDLVAKVVPAAHDFMAGALEKVGATYRADQIQAADEKYISRTDAPLVAASGELVPMLPMQRSMYMAAKTQEKSGVYHVQTRFSFRAPWDRVLIGQAWKIMESRHASLTFTCMWDGIGFPVFRASSASGLLLGADDFGQLTRDNRERRWDFLISADRKQSYNMEKGPLVRVRFSHMGDGNIQGFISHHHIVLDGRSKRKLIGSFVETYRTLLNGDTPDTAESMPISDYVRRSLNRTDNANRDFWNANIAKVDNAISFPGDADFSHAGKDSSLERVVFLQLEELEFLRAAAANAGVTLACICAASWALTLSHFANDDTVTFGLTIGGNANISERMTLPIGCLITSIPLFIDIPPDETVHDFLRRLKNCMASAAGLGYADLTKLSADAGIPVTRVPLESVVVFDDLRSERSGENSKIHIETIQDMTDIPLEIQFAADDQLKISLKAKDKSRLQAMHRFADHIRHILVTLPTALDKKIRDLPLVDSEERQRLLVNYNKTEQDFPLEKTVMQILEEKGRQNKGSVSDSEGHVALRDVLAISASLATSMRSHFADGHNHLLVLTRRNRWFLTGMLAAFRLNVAYIPLDPDNIETRTISVMEQSQAKAMVVDRDTHAQALALLRETGLDIPVYVANDEGHADFTDSIDQSEPDSCAYTIFTSGSTGVPKGAMVEHKGMLNHIYAKIMDLSLTDNDKVAQSASPVFDVSVWQFLTALVLGGTTHIFPADVAKDPLAMLQQTEKEEITVLEIVPSFMRVLLDAMEVMTVAERPHLEKLRWLMLTGEALTSDLCERWYALYPGIRIINAYGPTECSDDVAHYVVELDRLVPDSPVVPIGKPVANMKLVVLDRYGRPQIRGVPGELYVGGIGVGRGYFRDEEKTAKAFVPSHLPEMDNGRLYRTGDTVRMQEDGELVFLGRRDNQVKINGHRIELGDIEATFEKMPVIRQAVCIFDPSKRTGALTLIVKAGSEEDQAILKEKLKEYAANNLSVAMRPSDFIFVDSIPTLPSGKADRKALQKKAEGIAVRPAENASTSSEAIMRDIWKKVLQAEKVDLDDNFFKLGGHSLALVSVQTEIRKRLSVVVPISALFEAMTLQDFIDVADRKIKENPITK